MTNICSLKFNEPSRPTGSISWPLGVGVPLADGSYTSLTNLSISGVASRSSSLLSWPSNSSVQWCLLDWIQSYTGSAPADLTVQEGTTPTNPVATLSVTDGAGSITVDTGAVSFVVSKTAYKGPETITYSGGAATAGGSVYWTDSDGTSRYAHEATPTSVAVDRQNAMTVVIKAEGYYQQASSSVDEGKYIHYIQAWVGSPYIRIYNSFIWDRHLNLKLSIAINPDNILTTVRGSSGSVTHGWSTRDAVTIFSSTTIPTTTPQVVPSPLDGSSDTTYYVRALSSTTLALFPTADDATNNTNRITFTNTGVGVVTLTRAKPIVAQYGFNWTLGFTGASARSGKYVAGVDTPTTTAVTSNTVSALCVSGASYNIDGTSATGGLSGWQCILNAGATLGLGMSVRDFQYQTPSELRVNATDANVRFWSDTGAAPVMSLRFADQALPSSVAPSQQEWLGNFQTAEPDPYGFKKTHELWLFPWVSTANGTLVNDYVQSPPGCIADPVYTCGLNVWPFERISNIDDTPSQYDIIETGVEKTFDFLVGQRERTGWPVYERKNLTWGDMRLFDSSNRTFDNGNYNWPLLPWLLYFRSGTRKYIYEGERNSRHVMDVDMVHLTNAASSGTYHHVAGRPYHAGAVHWGQGPLQANFWSHPQYLVCYYVLTGYPPARDVLEMIEAEMVASNYHASGGANPEELSREQYGKMDAIMVLYHWTKTANFLTAADTWADDYLLAQATDNDTTTAASLFPENNFYYFWMPHLRDYAVLGERPDLDVAIVDQSRDFAYTPARYYDTPNYFCEGEDASRYDRNRRNTIAFALAFEITGDERYMRAALDDATRQSASVQESGSISGDGSFVGWSSTARIYLPIYMHGALTCLGTWIKQSSPALGTWRGNWPLLGSEVISVSASPYTYLSSHTFKVFKNSPEDCHVKLLMKWTNLTSGEYKTSATAWGNFRAILTDPAGSSTTTSLNATTEVFSDKTVTLSGDQGVWTLVVQGEPSITWIAPVTDAAGLVLSRSDANLMIETSFGPADIYFKLTSGSTEVILDEYYPAKNYLVRPIRVLAEDDTELGEWVYDDSTSKTISVGAAYRDDVLSFCKGWMEDVPAGPTDRVGLTLQNCERLYAVQADQWFDPANPPTYPDGTGYQSAGTGVLGLNQQSASAATLASRLPSTQTLSRG